MQRSVDGPEAAWYDVDQAARWLGLTVSEFRSEVSKHPELLPWTKVGKAHRWAWMDLVVYHHVRSRLPGVSGNGKDDDE